MGRKAKRRQFGAVRRLRSGRYQARVLDAEAGTLTSLGTYATIADADAAIALAQADQVRGRWVDPRRGQVTVRAYANAWLQQHPTLRPRTRETYRSLLDLHVLPKLGDYELGKVTTAVVRGWHGALLLGESPGQAPKAYRLLNTIFNTAVADELVSRSPCVLKGAGVEKSRERPVATVEQVWQLADAMPAAFRLFVLIAGFVGLRLGEQQGLRRHDIDLAQRTINIHEQIQELAKGGFYTGPPKTHAGVRNVEVPAFLVGELQRHLACFAGAGPDGLLYPGSNGGPFRRQTLRRAFRRAKTEVGLPEHFTVHDMRHTAHTLYAVAGATTREAMAHMGQSTADAALRYQHATQERARIVAARIEQHVASVAPDRVANVITFPRAQGGA
jgi:integrase